MAYVVIDGTLIPIDRIAVDRPFCSGKHKRHGVNLQIVPSKTDEERLLVVSPELADVLSTVIRRIGEPDGTAPLVPVYDRYECVWRIAEIRDNLLARIAEAEHEGWLGEVEGLKISLAGVEDKLAPIDQRSHTVVELGIPPVGPTQ